MRIHLVDLRMQYIIQNTQLEATRTRLRIMEKGNSTEAIKQLEKETEQSIAELNDTRTFLLQSNEPREFLEDEKIARLE